MPSIPLKSTVIAVLLLCLLCPAFARAQQVFSFSQHPDAVICTVPGAAARTIAVAVGQNPTGLCPEAAIVSYVIHLHREDHAASPVRAGSTQQKNSGRAP